MKVSLTKDELKEILSGALKRFANEGQEAEVDISEYSSQGYCVVTFKDKVPEPEKIQDEEIENVEG